MEKKEYNGWSNYETWQCALWLDNDRDLYHAAKFCHNEEELQELVHDHLYEDMKSASWDSRKSLQNAIYGFIFA